MKKIEVATKNGGKIFVPVYASTADVVKAFGEEETLKLLNRQIRTDRVNEANRKVSQSARMKREMKDLGLSKEEQDALLEKVFEEARKQAELKKKA